MSKTNLSDFESDELLALVNLDIEKGNIESALLKLKSILKSNDILPEAYAIAARTYAQLGLYERAKDHYTTFLKLRPESINELFQLGMTQFDTGELDSALATWATVLTKEPVHPPALFFRGMVLAQQNSLADAKVMLETLLNSAPTDNLYYNRAQELLRAINSGQNSEKTGTFADATLPKDAYKVEH